MDPILRAKQRTARILKTFGINVTFSYNREARPQLYHHGLLLYGKTRKHNLFDALLEGVYQSLMTECFNCLPIYENILVEQFEDDGVIQESSDLNCLSIISEPLVEQTGVKSRPLMIQA